VNAAEQPPQSEQQAHHNRRVLHATCSKHGACIGFTNVAVSKRDGQIVVDPHVTGQCVLTLAEDEAVALRDALSEWLG
jgi:hypothetical protein